MCGGSSSSLDEENPADPSGVGKTFSTPTKACEPPDASPEICSDSDVGAWSAKATDCDDSDPGVNPSADEICDGVDNDCDGTLDPSRCDCDSGDTRECGEPDGEGGFVTTGQCEVGSQTCIEGSWGSCDATFPEEETCDGQDEDCDGTADEGTLTDCWEDGDQDGYGPSGAAHDTVCGGCGTGWTDIDPNDSADCNDGDDRIHPDQTDWFPEARDFNCDGTVQKRWPLEDHRGGCVTQATDSCSKGCERFVGWNVFRLSDPPACGDSEHWVTSDATCFCTTGECENANSYTKTQTCR